LKLLWIRQRDILDIGFECIFEYRLKQTLLAFSTGYQPHSLNGTFRRMMRDIGLFVGSEGQARTLYSLRHTNTTLESL
jgi:hypothetical protein